MLIADIEIVEYLREVGPRSDRWPGADFYDYDIHVVDVFRGYVRLEIIGHDSAGILDIALPSSNAVASWHYMEPLTSNDWCGQLLTEFDEEVDTLGLGPSRLHQIVDGLEWLIVDPYGLRVNDHDEHERLLETSGPEGWAGLRTNYFWTAM